MKHTILAILMLAAMPASAQESAPPALTAEQVAYQADFDQAWQEACGKYPALADANSALFKEVDRRYQALLAADDRHMANPRFILALAATAATCLPQQPPSPPCVTPSASLAESSRRQQEIIRNAAVTTIADPEYQRQHKIAIAQILSKYPEGTDSDSAFFKTFNMRLDKVTKENDPRLNDPMWIVTLAKEVARDLLANGMQALINYDQLSPEEKMSIYNLTQADLDQAAAAARPRPAPTSATPNAWKSLEQLNQETRQLDEEIERIEAQQRQLEAEDRAAASENRAALERRQIIRQQEAILQEQERVAEELRLQEIRRRGGFTIPGKKRR